MTLDPALIAAVAALLGALIGAGAGVASQLISAAHTSRNERRRLAIDAGFREWDLMHERAKASPAGAEVFPPVLFVYFHYELIRLFDKRGGLTAKDYDDLVRRRNRLRDVIREDSDRRTTRG